MPAMASEAPISCRKPRRETESSHSDAPLGNSRCIISWNSGEPASSSRLRQYSGPCASASFCSTVARSSFLPGQTSSRFVLLASSIFMASGLHSRKLGSRTSAVARIAARDVLHGAQLILLDERAAERVLIGVAGAVDFNDVHGIGLLIRHVENLIP